MCRMSSRRGRRATTDAPPAIRHRRRSPARRPRSSSASRPDAWARRATAPSGRALRQRAADERRVLERNAHGGSVRAHLHACRALRPSETEVAFRCELDAAAERGAVEGHVVDVAPRTALAAVVTADARVLVDGDLECAERPRDRTRRAADHADRIRALVAGLWHAPAPELRPFAHKPRNAAVRVRAGADAVVAPRAGAEVDE